MNKTISSALISVYDKDGLEQIIEQFKRLNITVYSTGGTQKHLEAHGVSVYRVEDLTGYPSILDGRVKTLHPKIFGGILAKREASHQDQLTEYDIPKLDLVIVDLYPFEETVAHEDDENKIIEKIDIGGISLIRAAAKNYRDIVVVPSKDHYSELSRILSDHDGRSTVEDRKALATEAFKISSHYDTAIFNYFADNELSSDCLKISSIQAKTLRYGENPHQSAQYFGDLDAEFDKLNGKELSYNNLVDIDSAIDLMREFEDDLVTFAILKHTNSCGLATRGTLLEAYNAALAGDPISAFGGILITNGIIDAATAAAIDQQFYEVLIAEDFDQEALEILKKKKNRVLLRRHRLAPQKKKIKNLLGGYIRQDADLKIEHSAQLEVKTDKAPTPKEIRQLLFANKIAKHLKSNTIVIANNDQLLGMGCGQTSRVDACKQAIDKAIRMGFDLSGAVMASDAFFPFPDCVEIAHKAGIVSTIQPGGSRNDQMSIDYCNNHGLSMIFTGARHFKH